MADTFANLTPQQSKADATIELEMHELARFMPGSKVPVLIGKHAGESNSAYMASIVKGSSDKNARKAARGNITPQMLDEQREKSRSRYAKFVITGWRNVFNADGRESEFNYENCLAFLNALSSENFSEIMDHFGDPEKFTNEALSSDEAEEVGNGSSQP